MKTLYTLLLAIAVIGIAGCPTSTTPAGDAAVSAAIPSGPAVTHRPRRHSSAPVLPPETRTPMQLAQAACVNGRCVGVKPLLAAGGSTPIIPPSWTVPAWFIDPANSATCAADTNSGTSATCTGGCTGGTCPSGIGPLLTYQELNVHRWECLGNPVACPRLRQNTTVTFLSSQSSNTDPVYVRWGIENGAQTTITGPALTTLATGTLGTTVAKSRSTNTFPFRSTFNGSAAVGGFFSCTHTSTTGFGWLNTSIGANVFTTTQPLTTGTTFALASAATEVDTCTTGDAFTLYNAPVSVNIVDFEPIFVDADGGFDNWASIVHITVLDPTGIADDPIFIGSHTAFLESSVQRVIEVANAINIEENVSHLLSNSLTLGGVTASGTAMAPFSAVQFTVNAGSIGGPGAFFADFGGVFFSNDPILNGALGASAGTNTLADDLTSTSSSVFIPTSSFLTVGLNFSIATSQVVYGGGTLEMKGPGRANYPVGAGAAAATFPLTGGITLNNQTHACIGVPTVTSPTLTCNVVVSTTTLDSDLGATAGCLWVEGGASVCNFGP